MVTRTLPRWTRTLYVVLLATVAALAGTPAASQTADARVSDRQLRVGEQTTYSLTLRGDRGSGIAPPAASGALRLISPQPALDVTTTLNGETERRLAWRYEATRPGTGRIGALRVRVGGRAVTLGAQEVTVEQAAATATAPSGPSELFVRAEPSRQTAVVGQQVLVDYVLYFEPSVQPRQTAPIGTWDAAGFWREEMDVPATYPRPVTLDGRTYEAVTVRRVALFPTRSGRLELAPMAFTVDLLRTDRRFSNDPFAPFFSPFASRFDEEEVTAPAVSIEVEELPPGAPPGFSGAVGQFTVSARVDNRRVEAGDAVQLQVALAGTGNVATLDPPEIAAPDVFDVYDPVEDREISRRAEPLRGVKTFTYTLVPQGGGTFEVPPAAWSYYDPADGQYKTLRTDPVEIIVDGPPVADDASAPGPSAGGPAALMTSADWRRPSESVGWLWALLGGGLAFPAVAAALLAAARVGRERLEADTPARRRRRARTGVQRRLAAARPLGGAEGFGEVERALRAFLADRLDLPASVRSRAEVAEALTLSGVPDDLRDQTLALLAASERGQYAPGLPGTPDASTLAHEAATVADAIDRQATGAARRSRWRPRLRRSRA